MATKTIVLVTGANTGIGYEVVKALLQSSNGPYHILLAGRDLKKANEAADTLKQEFPQSASEVSTLQLDVTDDASIQKAFETVQANPGHIDALVNNAVLIPTCAGFDSSITSGEITVREAWNAAWDVNVSGTHITTTTFIPLLLKSASPRLLFVTSGLSTFSGMATGSHARYHEPPAGWPKPPAIGALSYMSSKAGMNMMFLDWNRVLKNDGVKVFCISPGFLATGLGGVGKDRLKHMGAAHASVGGVFIGEVIEGKRDADTGKVINKDGIQAW